MGPTYSPLNMTAESWPEPDWSQWGIEGVWRTFMKYCCVVPSGSWTTSLPVEEKELPPPALFDKSFAPEGRTEMW